MQHEKPRYLPLVEHQESSPTPHDPPLPLNEKDYHASNIVAVERERKKRGLHFLSTKNSSQISVSF